VPVPLGKEAEARRLTAEFKKQLVQ
jgi:hypothetical protein